MTEDRLDRFALLWLDRRIEGQHRPIHLPLRKIPAEIARDPEFGAIKFHFTGVAMIDLESVVEPAKMLAAAMIAMARVTGRRGIEVALTEHRATTGFDNGSVHGPFVG